MFRKIQRFYFKQLNSNYVTKASQVDVELDERLKPNFESNEYKPRKHPGKIRVKNASVPNHIQKAIKIILDDATAKTHYKDSLKLANYLYSRLLPPEERDIEIKTKELYDKISSKVLPKNVELSEDKFDKYNKKIELKVYNNLKNMVYRWGNIDYDEVTCLQYLMSRAAPEYAVLVRIFDDILMKYPDYKPRSFFDFGSGIGTGTWAVNHYWEKNLFEYFSVDTSSNMNDLARKILSGGRENSDIPYRGYFQRQFLPSASKLKYNIVLSAYSLFELPNMKSRLQTIQKLWNKTEDFLIIVEQGTNAGFKAVNEAREYILNLQPPSNGYAFSPCPHNNVCPRYLEQDTPCNFLMQYEPLQFIEKSTTKAELFTYVILKKGDRPLGDEQWPRVVRAPIVRSGHTICRLCNKKGELQEIVFRKAKHDKDVYRCARSSYWGDVLPIK